MKIDSFPFTMIEFYVNSVSIELEEYKDVDGLDQDELIGEQSVDIKFGLDFDDEEGEVVILFSLSSGIDEIVPLGYKYKIEAVGIFENNIPDNTSENGAEEERTFYKNCMTHTLGYIRGFLLNITKSMQYGSYFLPELDIDELIDKELFDQDF